MKPKQQTEIIDVESIAQDIYVDINRTIRELNLQREFYRRDYDGVSSAEYIVAKLVADLLVDGRMDVVGLVRCVEGEGGPIVSQFRDFVRSELSELESRDPDQLFECIRENCIDGGLVFNDALENELYEEIERQLGEVQS